LAIALEQRVLRHKTQENDGYSALVIEIVGEAKKSTMRSEIRVQEVDLQNFPVGKVLDTTAFGRTINGKSFLVFLKENDSSE
jgi:hypothetical protein